MSLRFSQTHVEQAWQEEIDSRVWLGRKQEATTGCQQGWSGLRLPIERKGRCHR